MFGRKKKKEVKETKPEKTGDIESKRANEGRQKIDEREKERKQKEKAMITLREDAGRFIDEEAKKTGKTKMEVLDTLFEHGFAVVEFDETQGRASLVWDSWTSPIPAIPEKERYSEKYLREFRRLRENFPPVAAGVEWHRDFSAGSGFTVQIDDPKDKHQMEMKKYIEDLSRNIYQDQYTVGLDNILDIMMDLALTDGCSAAEIVYEVEVDFVDYIEDWQEVELPTTGKIAQVMVPKEPQWKSTNDKTGDGLGGITRLKIIEDAATRLRPYRHPVSGEILYWTLDEKGKSESVKQGWGTQRALQEQQRKKVLKFHPWEILWLSWNQRGTNLKGMSIIQPVYSVARFVEAIQKAVGVGFRRWANKKYFFIAGSEKRPWSKPHVNQFLKALEKMIANNWIGIPVPQGFDIKEMGGEQSVFEGKNLLDYLTAQIAAGMQYPLEFLETGRSGASDKAWLAWTVRYGRNQQQIRRAIEHQLWEKHLFCKAGKTYRVKKKGVKPIEQERRPVYVPKLQWRGEGRWHRERKTELLSGLLNVANPVDTPLKMAIQRGIGEVLGFGEIDWDVIQEIFNIQSETRLSEAKREKLKSQAQLEIDEELRKQGKLKEVIKARMEAALVRTQQPAGTPEEELKRRGEKRKEGGVSRTTRGEKATTPEKGKARPMGPSRIPKRVVEEAVKTEKMKQQKLEIEIQEAKADLEGALKRKDMDMNVKLSSKEKSAWLKSMAETERLKHEKLKAETATIKRDFAEGKEIRLPKKSSDQITKAMLETESARRENIIVEKKLTEEREEKRRAREDKEIELAKSVLETEKVKQGRIIAESKRTAKLAEEREAREKERIATEKKKSEIEMETQRLTQEKLKADMERLKNVEIEETERKNREEEAAKALAETERLKQEELKARMEREKAETERIKSLTTDVVPPSKAEEIANMMLETERLKQAELAKTEKMKREQIKIETAKVQAEFDRQQKKIKLLDKLEERMKKKKKKRIKK